MLGGLRALRAVGVEPGVLHLNEGHSAFAVLEMVRHVMATDALRFEDACRRVATLTCFTMLNTPRRPFEASGTSGQKVVLNGGLNLSVLDGWWAEAYDGLNGFAVGMGETHADLEVQDRRDAEHLYRTLEREVLPPFYTRDVDGLPRAPG